MSTLLRKMLASASVVAIISTLMVSTAFAASYSDVAEGDVWYDAVEQGASDGVFTSGGEFMPFEAVDRAHMAMYAAKAAGLDPVPYKGGFPDVAAGHPQADWIQAVVDNGIQKGYDDGNFGPSDILLRGQASIILKNAFSIEPLEGCAPSFPDLSTSHYAYGAIQDMYCWSVLNGYENGNFGPNDTLVKYQVAIIINNAKYHLEARPVDDTTTPVSSGEVTITEGAEMPTAKTVPKGATSVPFMSFTLTAGDEEATVDGITFARQGVGTTSDFSNVYIYEGISRLTSGRSISSDTNTVEFSSLAWNLAPGESRTFTLRADIASGATASDEHRFYIHSVSGATAGGEVNLAGPYMTIGGQSAGTVTVEKNGTLTNPSLGDNGAKVSQFKVSASGEDVSLKWINVYLAGTISQNELSNFKLYKGTSVSDANLVAEQTGVSSQDTIDFDLGDGIDIEDGNEQIFVVTADLDGDADDTVITYISETTDLYAVGEVYGTGSAATITSFDTSGEGHTVTLQGGEITLSFEGPSASDVAVDTKKVSFLNFDLKADRDIEVKQLVVVVDDTNCDLTDDTNDLVNSTAGSANFANIRIMEGDKNLMETEDFTITSPSTDDANDDCSQQLTFTDSFYVDKGETKSMSVKMDIDDNAQAADDVRVTLNAISTTAGIKDVATNKFLSDIVPTSAIVGNNLTTVSSTLEINLASTPVSDTFVKGTNNVPIVGFLFKSGTADSVHITGITLTGYMDEDGATSDFAGTAGSDNSVNLKDIVNNVRLYEDGYAADKTPVAGPKGVESGGTVVFDNMSYDIAASTTKKLVVVGDISTNAFVNSDAETFAFDLNDVSADITAEDSDGDTVTATNDSRNDAGNNGTTGGYDPNIYVTTANSGTLAVTTKASTTPSSNIVIAGRKGVEVARFEFSATTEDITVNDITLGYVSYAIDEGQVPAADELVSVSIYDADDLTTPLGTGFVQSGIVDLDNIGFVVPADDSATLVVTTDINTLPKGADSGNAFAIGLKTVDEAQGSAGTDVAVTTTTDLTCSQTFTTNALDGSLGDAYSADTDSDADDVDDDLTATLDGACSEISVGDIIFLDDTTDEYFVVLDKDADDDDTETDYTVGRGGFGSTGVDAHTAVNLASSGSAIMKAKGNYMVVRETKPTFTTVPYAANTKLTNGSSVGLYKFTVDAESEEDVSLGRLVFKVTGQIAGVQLGLDPDSTPTDDADDPSEKNGTTAGTDGLATSASNGATPVTRITSVSLYDVTDGETVSNLTVTYQNDDDVAVGYIVVDFGTEEEIGASGKTYELRASVSGVANNGDFISVLINDEQPSRSKLFTETRTSAKESTLLDPDDVGAGLAEPTILDDVVWADESATSHSGSTLDWTNGYLLKSLKTVAQTLTFTTS